MKTYQIPRTDLKTQRIALGCMRMSNLSIEKAATVIETALENKINYFDHADIYGQGKSELIFAEAITQLGYSRDQYILQSKVGIRNGYYDWSYNHIIKSTESILKRLNTDYLDVLLLHRPDTLMDLDEVAEAFHKLVQSGKVLYFGLSNVNAMQMELIQSRVDVPLVFNQLQFGPAHTPLIDLGLNVNTKKKSALDVSQPTLEYCQLNQVTIQAWSPFQVDLKQGLFMNHSDYQLLTKVIHQMAAKYGESFEAIVVGWILRHPANMQVIVGSMNPTRIQKMAQALTISMSREDWYTIYKAAGNSLP